MLSLPDQIDRATSYIKQLRERVDELRARKEQAVITSTTPQNNDNSTDRRMLESEELRLPVLELNEVMGTGLQINLRSESSSSKNGKYNSTSHVVLARSISILHEEGAEVVSASLVHRGSKVFYTIHAQVTKRFVILDHGKRLFRS